MLCLQLSFYQGKQLLRSNYLTLICKHSHTLHYYQRHEIEPERSETGADWGAIILRTSFHNIATEIQQVDHTQSMHGYMRGNVDMLNMQHPPWWVNTSTIITQQRSKFVQRKL